MPFFFRLPPRRRLKYGLMCNNLPATIVIPAALSSPGRNPVQPSPPDVCPMAREPLCPRQRRWVPSRQHTSLQPSSHPHLRLPRTPPGIGQRAGALMYFFPPPGWLPGSPYLMSPCLHVRLMPLQAENGVPCVFLCCLPHCYPPVLAQVLPPPRRLASPLPVSTCWDTTAPVMRPFLNLIAYPIGVNPLTPCLPAAQVQ